MKRLFVDPEIEMMFIRCEAITEGDDGGDGEGDVSWGDFED